MSGAWPIRETQPYHWVSHAVVHENWKLLTNRDGSYSELYDLAINPYEKIDLKVSKPEVVRQLMRQLDQWKETLPAEPTGDVFSNERTETTSAPGQ
jgi:hypothetical protein